MMRASALFAAAACAAFSLPAAAAVGDWSLGQRAEVRIVAAGVDAGGSLVGGIEIRLPAGWVTYWRYPGDAGVAPAFDFGSSTNLSNPEVSFPVPTREDDGFTATNVYKNGVVLPFTATVADPTAPVVIDVDAKIGACSEVCIPEDIAAHLTVVPGPDDVTVANALAVVRKRIPGAAVPGAFAFTSVARAGGTERRPVFTFTGVVPDPANTTLFVEGPAGWAPYTPDLVGTTGNESSWSVKFSRLGAETPIAGARFRLTVLSAGQAIDQTLTLP